MKNGVNEQGEYYPEDDPSFLLVIMLLAVLIAAIVALVWVIGS